MKKIALSLVLAGSIFAADNLVQSIDLGFTNTTGNSKTTNLNGKYALAYKTIGLYNQELKTKFNIQAFYAKNDGVKSNEEYTSYLGLEQFIYDGWLGYFDLNWLRNPDFKNYNHKIDTSAGIGKEIYKTDTSNLIVKLGIGYSYYDFADSTPNDDFASLNQALEYNNKLNENSLFYTKLNALEGFDDFSKNYELGTTFGLKFNLTNNVHAVMEEQISYDNQPPAGFKKTDTKTIIRLGLSF